MKCKFIKSDKKVCGNNAMFEDKFCFWHSKKISEDEKNKQRSKGGKNKIIKVNSNFEQYELSNIADVLKLNTVLINRVLQNKLDLRVATGIVYMLNLHSKGLELKQNNLHEFPEKITITFKSKEFPTSGTIDGSEKDMLE